MTKPTTTKRLRRRKYTHARPLTVANKHKIDARATEMLRVCAAQFDACGDLDTAVRDDICTGLAYLVHSAYDTMAMGMEISDTTAWMAFIDNSTAEWFRQRGFAEWFCLAAASLFHTSRPRTLAEIAERITIRRSPGRKQKKPTQSA